MKITKAILAAANAEKIDYYTKKMDAYPCYLRTHKGARTRLAHALEVKIKLEDGLPISRHILAGYFGAGVELVD